MSDERDEWVRVESEDELRPGMAVQLRPCRWCGRVDTFWLGEEVPPCAFVPRNPDGSIAKLARRAFEKRGRNCPAAVRTHGQFASAIRECRLYRLRDLPAEETTVATKRRVSVKAGR